MKELLDENQQNQICGDDGQRNGWLTGKQRGRYLLKHNQRFSVVKIDQREKMRKSVAKDGDTVVRRVNEYSYTITFDSEELERKFPSGKSTLTDIFTALVNNKANLLNSEGFIHIKEYTMDGYECRCQEYTEFLPPNRTDH